MNTKSTIVVSTAFGLAPRSAIPSVLLAMICLTFAPATPRAGIIDTVAGTGTAGYSGDFGQALLAEMSSPMALAVDPSGTFYFSAFFQYRIRKVDMSSGIIWPAAGNGVCGYSGDGGQALLAQTSTVTGIAFDNSGNMYLAEVWTQRIRKVDSSGTITTFAGDGTLGFSGDGGSATAAQFSFPQALATDSSGNLYVADMYNNRIRKIDTGGIITTVAGGGAVLGDGGPATSALLTNPSAVFVDGAGNIFIGADYRIRKVDTSGNISTIAGDGTDGNSGDRLPATSARIGFVGGIAVDDYGNIYFTDRTHSVIRRIDTRGIINTIAGNGMPNFGGDGGDSRYALVGEPWGIALDQSGNLYFADNYNYRIRRIKVEGPMAVSVTKYQSIDTALIGDAVTYRIVVTNAGSTTIHAMMISDTLSPVITNVTTSQPAGFAAPGKWSVTGGTLYQWVESGLNMVVGQTFTFTITGQVGYVDQNSSIQNRVRVSATSLWDIAVCESNLATLECLARPKATVQKEQAVAGVFGAMQGIVGDSITYRIVVKNAGSTTITAMTVVDTLSPPVMVNAASSEPTGFGAPVVTHVGGVGTRYVWSATGLSLGAGADFTFTITGTIGSGSEGMTVPNKAWALVTGDGGTAVADPALDALMVPHDSTLLMVAYHFSVAVSKELVQAGVYSGNPVQYRIVVTNDGATTIATIVVSDTIAPEIVSITTSQPAGFVPPVKSAVPGGTHYGWSSAAPKLAPGDSWTFTITGQIGYVGAATGISNTAFALAGSGMPEFLFTAVPSNAVSFTAFPTPVVGVSVLKQQLQAGPHAGDAVAYRIVVTNSGAATLSAVTVVDTLSPLVVSVTTSQPAEFTAPLKTDVANGTRYEWSATGLSLGIGKSFTFTITGKVGHAAADTIVRNTAHAVVDSAAGPSQAQSAPVQFTAKADALPDGSSLLSADMSPGDIKVVGGVSGIVNLSLGDIATILVQPVSAGEIRVRIYDIDAVLVAEMVEVGDGNNTVVFQWEGRDTSGNPVSPGLFPVYVEGAGVSKRDTIVIVR